MHSISHQNIVAEKAEPAQPLINRSKDCKETLEEYGLSYREEGFYLQVGDALSKGWVLHVSSIRLQFSPLLKAVLPVLIDSKVAFKIPRDKDTAKNLLDGTLGYTQLGKLICIYPENESLALELAKDLIKVTQEFRSPSIPTDKLLGSTVFAVYEDPKSLAYNIPFRLPKSITWPFDEITSLVEAGKKPLLNYRYRPLSIIKSDVKGRVIQGNYFKSLFNIKLCIIKEGIKNMWADEFGRDIVDRINWQYELYKDLGDHIPTPRIFDLFQENENTYLAMEFIKGESLHYRIDSIFNGNSVHQLSINSKLSIAEVFLKILSVIEILHQKGYVHRDITPENFIITKGGQVFLIDMELTYSIPRRYPNPVFKLGTHGYMSPEQENSETPTIKEDIYALGCLLFFCFTGMFPVKLDTENNESILSNLEFLTGNITLSQLIKDCISRTPEDRPLISIIRKEIEKYKKDIESTQSKSSLSLNREINNSRITEIINKSLAGLNSSRIMNDNKVWISQNNNSDVTGTRSMDRAPGLGFHTGMTGILYSVAMAKRLGYTIDPCLPGFNASWNYIQTTYPDLTTSIPPGLYEGLAGIALAMNEGLNSNLLTNFVTIEQLQSLFIPVSSEIDLARGIAGQGIALLNCISNLPIEFCQLNFTNYIDTLLYTQRTDGSWHIYRNSGRSKDNMIGLSYGTAGILFFLSKYYQNFPESRLVLPIEKGMSWLAKNLHKEEDRYCWTISTKSKSDNSIDSSLGTPGIALVFIKAYEILHNQEYKTIAEKVLKSMPAQPINSDYTQAFGLSGLGELYMEAYIAFKTEEWHDRSKWLINLFSRTFLEDKRGKGYWSVNIYPDLEGDLMTGISGIMHFLMRYQMKDKIGYIY